MTHWPQALATQLVECYTKPSWLLRKHGESWRADPEVLADAQDDAARLAIYDQERAGLAPDCGMWHLPRQVAFAKLRALVQGGEIVRRELNLTN